MIEDFINYHAYLFGITNIFLIDNNTTNPYVLNVYEKFKQKGGTIYPCSSNYFEQGNKTSEIINIHKHEYEFIIPLDTDEFFYYEKSENNFSLENLYNYLKNLPKNIDKFDLFCYNKIKFKKFRMNTPRKEGGLGKDLKLTLLADKTMAISRDYGVLIEDAGVALR